MPPPLAQPVFTIGHSNHAIEEFITLLRKHAVQSVADVRSSPFSRYSPQFNEGPLRESLSEAGIGYVYLGKELGGRPENPACYANGSVDFNRVEETEECQRGLEQLCARARTERVAVMCAEKDPLNCHRMVLVARALRGRGIEAVHILADGRLEPNAEAERRLARMLHIERSLFEPDLNEAELIERAYDLRARSVAYAAETREDVAVGDDAT